MECELRKKITKINAKLQPVSFRNIQHVSVIKIDKFINDLDMI